MSENKNISQDVVAHMAQLSRLAVSDEEKALFARQFGDILAYMDVLAQVDTLEQLLRDLVHARNDLARANGFDNFADYGDLAMQRRGTPLQPREPCHPHARRPARAQASP